MDTAEGKAKAMRSASSPRLEGMLIYCLVAAASALALVGGGATSALFFGMLLLFGLLTALAEPLIAPLKKDRREGE